MNDDIFAGDLHGFLVYPTAWKKPEDHHFTPIRVLKHIHAAKYGVQLNAPVQMELPRTLGGVMFGSSYDKPNSLLHEQAASKLFEQPHKDFLMMADDATRHHLGVPEDSQGDFTHVHGIGSWENDVEPSMVTVFHRPVEGLQLQRIGSEIGTWARQHAILAFSPHPGGQEQLLHMRLKTHPPVHRLSVPMLAKISQTIHGEFNKYFDPKDDGGRSFWMPGRSILPDASGHTDVLIWVPQDAGVAGRNRIHQAFSTINSKLGGTRQPTMWPGTGLMLGGTSPYSDEEAKFLDDAEKRELAIGNYKEAYENPEPLVHGSVMSPEAAVGIAAKRQGKRIVHLRDFLGRYKNRLNREGRKLKLGRMPRETVEAHAAAMGANPHDDAPPLVFADHLSDYGDPREDIVRQQVARGRRSNTNYLFDNERWKTPQETFRETSYGANGYDYGLATSGNPAGEPTGHMTFVPHRFDDSVIVHWYPHMYHQTESGPLSGVFTRQQATEIANHVGINTHLATSTNDPNEFEFHDWSQHPEQLARSPAGTGAVVRGVFYAPGKMMPDAVPLQTGSAPDQSGAAPKESLLARIRRRFKKRVVPETLTLSRQPVKFNLIDMEGLHAEIQKNPNDSAPWGVMADAWDDQGKPALANLFRQFMNPKDYYNGHAFPLVNTTQYDLERMRRPALANRGDTSLLGHTARIPYEIIPLRNSPEHYQVRILARGRTHVIGSAIVPNLQAQHLASEMEFVLPHWIDQGHNFKREIGIPDHEPPHLTYRGIAPEGQG